MQRWHSVFDIFIYDFFNVRLKCKNHVYYDWSVFWAHFFPVYVPVQFAIFYKEKEKEKESTRLKIFFEVWHLLLWLDKAISVNFEMNLIIHHKLWFTITSQINHKSLLFSLFSILFFLLRFSFSCKIVLFFNHEPEIMLNFCTALN